MEGNTDVKSLDIIAKGDRADERLRDPRRENKM